MTSPIDPAGRIDRIRRTRRARARRADEAQETFESQRAPQIAPVDPPQPAPDAGDAAEAIFAAQLFGQDAVSPGEPQVFKAAKLTYNRVEWSGKADRRAPPGRLKDEDI